VIESIIAELDVEIARLQKVLALLANSGQKRGRPAKAASVSPVQPPRKKRVLSPKAKERIRQGQLRRGGSKESGQSECQKNFS
jgi:hypothetical protein